MQRTQNQRQRPAQSGSQTITLTAGPPPNLQIPDGTLVLRGASNSSRRVQWSEDVVDNEGLGRKKSKICCIFKKQRDFGESSSESSSDSSDDDSGSDGEGRGHGPEGEPHDHGDACNHRKRRRKQGGRPNAYDRMPKTRKDKDNDGTGKDGKDGDQPAPGASPTPAPANGDGA